MQCTRESCACTLPHTHRADDGTTESCGGCCTRLSDLCVTLGGHRILDNVNLHVHCGELSVIIGPNGAGKTTLFRAMLGEIPYTGKLHFFRSSGEFEPRPRIGYVPQKLEHDALSPVTVLDLFAAATSRWPLWIRCGAQARGRANEALSAINAADLINRRLGTLSGGQLQRVLLALALTPLPDILLLDEPVAGVDPDGVELFYNMISRLRADHHMTILLVSHDLSTAARFADRVVFLNRTVAADGPPDEVLRSDAVIRAFGHTLDGRHAADHRCHLDKGGNR